MSKRKIDELEDLFDDKNLSKLLKKEENDDHKPNNVIIESAICNSIKINSNKVNNCETWKKDISIGKPLNFGGSIIKSSSISNPIKLNSDIDKLSSWRKGIAIGKELNFGAGSSLVSNAINEDENDIVVADYVDIAPAKRISKRVVKKKKRGGSGLKEVLEVLAEEEVSVNSKRRRTWELWSVDDKFIFFEALNEYGKDFDKIQSHFQTKLKHKTRNLPAHYIKNKNQIRHFYYRTWHKISSHIDFSSDLGKNTRELYGLINYGELWKKIGGTIDDKFGSKLNELVQKGTTVLKVKGKTNRVKTPVCRALKKLSLGGQPLAKIKGKTKLPVKVMMDLRPRTTCDWCRVQKMAQNPHIRVLVGVQRRLSSIISCLEKKWKSYELKLKEGYLVKKEDEGSDSPEKCGDLILQPPRGTVIKSGSSRSDYECQIKRPKVKIKLSGFDVDPEDKGDVVSSHENGSFDTLERNKFEEMLSMQRQVISPTGCAELDPANDENSNDDPRSSPKVDGECFDDANEDAEEFLLESDQESSRSPIPLPDLDISDQSDLEALDDMKEYLDGKGDKDDDGKDYENNKDDKLDAEECKGEHEDDELKLESVDLGNLSNPLDGWNCETSGELTVGDIFMMVTPDSPDANSDSPVPFLRLDYGWKQEDQVSLGTGDLLARLVKLASGAGRNINRGRTNSQSSGGGSPSVRGLLSPHTSNMRSPVGRGGGLLSPVSRGDLGMGASKQIILPGPPRVLPEKPGSPLAVPLDGLEHEFRKPLAPPATRQGAMSAAFREQIGQYLPKFSNRRGRQSRSRAKQVVGRQLLQPLQPGPPPQQLVQLLTHTLPTQIVQVVQPNNQTILVTEHPNQVTFFPSQDCLSLSNIHNDNTDEAGIGNGISPILAPDPQNSPPQICIPSPLPRSPSPTPSLSSLMDLTFPESGPSTPTKISQEPFLPGIYPHNIVGDNSLLQTPPRPAPTPSPSRCLIDSQDLSLSSWSLTFGSPMKNSITLGYNEDSQSSNISSSSEVDRQLSAMMCETSVDFTSKFAKLAKHVAGGVGQENLPSS